MPFPFVFIFYQTALHLAIITEQIESVRLLMQCGADPTILDQNGFNALHHAVDAGFHSAIATLIEGPPRTSSLPITTVDPDALNLDGKFNTISYSFCRIWEICDKRPTAVIALQQQ